MLNEYTVHYEVRDTAGDQVYAGYSFVTADSVWEAGHTLKAQVTLDEGESLYIWDVAQNKL